MQKITPFLWFDQNAEQAVDHYVSIFENSKIGNVVRSGEAGPGPAGAVMLITFQLEGQEFIALNGGPVFHFNEAISLSVDCKSQPEVDHLWEKLCDGGEPGRCGWLKDKFGLSWQVVPTALAEMMQDENPEKALRVTQAMMTMGKLDIAELRRAYEGG
jgi:predicted 3-demethylubiquinone-9 3-methyltransferase (glyoxalase superfamily)